ncbi:MAG: hypothetical protein NVS9B15_11040 [Acidobacteriaceae bacterium]
MDRLRLAALLIPVLAAAPLYAQDWSKTFEVTGRPSLTVRADDAEVHIRGCECKKIDAHVTWQGYKPERIHITPSQSGDHVTLEVMTRNPHVNFNVNFGPSRRWLQVELTVPEELALDVQTGDGRVEADNLKGVLRFRTGDGRIELSGMDGKLAAHSGDGEIRIAGRFDELKLDTSDGPIEVEARDGSAVHGDWSIRTGDGRVRIRLPQSIQADFSVHTGDGSIHSDFPIVMSGELSKDGHRIEGKINGGGGMLSVTSGDGSVFLEKL